MNLKLKFFFYLAAVVCFALAAVGTRLSRRAPTVALVPLGLALFAFPTMWDTGTAAF